MSVVRPVVGLLLALNVLVIGLATSAQAQEPAAPATAGAGVLDFYMFKETLTTEAPTATTSETRSITPTAMTPGAYYGTPTAWTGFKVPHDMAFTNHAVATVWLTADTAAVWTNVQAEIRKGDTVVGTGTRGTALDSTTTAPLGWNILEAGSFWKLELTIPVRGTEWKEGDELRLTWSVWGVGHGASPAEIQVAYGSLEHPSGFSVSVDALGSFSSSSFERPLFLADKSLSWDAPQGTTSLTRASESAYNQQTVATMASSAEFSWGKIEATQDMVLAQDSFLEVWITVDGDAAVMRGVRAVLYIDGAACCQMDRGLLTTVFPAPGSTSIQTNRYLFGLGTGGKEIPAGAEIEIRFLTWSSTSDVGKITFLYGSETHPAALHLRVAGASTGGVSDIELSSKKTALTGEAGAAAAGEVTVTNLGAEMVNVSFNVSGERGVEFALAGPYAVNGNNSTTLDFQVDLTDAKAGDNFTVVLHAIVAGVEVANLTYTVDVVAVGSLPPSEDQEPGASPSGTSASNETAAAKTEGSGDTPGFGVAALSLGLLAAMAMVRRRRA